MGQGPEDDRQLNEALEACRPGSADLVSEPGLCFLVSELAANPELDARYERLQRLDGQVAAAFVQVPVPADLAERILARCAAEVEVAGPKIAVVTSPPTLPPRHPRRWAVLTGLAVAASLLALAWLGTSERPPLSKEALLQEANRQFAQSATAGVPGTALSERPAPAAYPFSAELRRGSETRWRWVGNFQGQAGVAYDLVGPEQTKATLYVLRAAVAGLPSAPAREPEPSAATRQCSISAWQAQGLVYVLIVDGGTRRYQQFLDLGPIT